MALAKAIANARYTYTAVYPYKLCALYNNQYTKSIHVKPSYQWTMLSRSGVVLVTIPNIRD